MSYLTFNQCYRQRMKISFYPMHIIRVLSHHRAYEALVKLSWRQSYMLDTR